jgi:hypothetical protein
MRALLPLFALTVACTPEPLPEDTGEPSAPVDTGDSGPGLVLGEDEVTFAPSGEYAGSTISLVWVDPASMLGANYVWGDTLSSVSAEKGALIELSAPDESLLREIDPAGHPGVFGTFFAPVLHMDVDGDGGHTAGESVLGIGSSWLFYAADSPSGIAAVPNALRGWNVLSIDLTAGRAETSSSKKGVPISASLVPQEEIRLGGEWDHAPVLHERFVVHSAVAMGGAAVEAPVLNDLVAESPFEFVVRGAPPADHYGEWLGGESAAVEIPEVYFDNDGDRSYSELDTRRHGVCSGAVPVTVTYFEKIGTLEVAVDLVAGGNSTGWNVVTTGDRLRVLPESELLSLRTGAGCPLVQ